MNSSTTGPNNPYALLEDAVNLDSTYWSGHRSKVVTPDIDWSRLKQRIGPADAQALLHERPEVFGDSRHRNAPGAQLALEKRKLARLCSTCASIFNQKRSEGWFGEWHKHHQSQSLLIRAAKDGCFICKDIEEESIKQSVILSSDCTLKYMVDWAGDACTLQFGHVAKARFGINYEPNLPYLYDMLLLSSTEVEPHLSRTSLSSSTASPDVLQLCRHWLQNCRLQHRQCQQRRSHARFRPSRLIHVERDQNRGIHASLDCINSKNDVPAYLTLSHCWGPRKFFTLRTCNLQKLQESIELRRLNKVFQDALLLTLELGFSYLWIDSLCIIQDSEADWLAESSRMGDVYKYSTCNIAATGFSDGRHGLFVERRLERSECPKLVAKWAGKWPDTTEPRRGSYYVVDKEFWEHEVSNAPLNRRGWVLQERLLSPCVLHFGTRQLFWECTTSKCCEVFPDRLPTVIEKPNTLKYLNFHEELGGNDGIDNRTTNKRADRQESKSRGKTQNAWPPNLQTYMAWHEVVEAYSLGELTRPEDKFIAISGVAKRVREIFADKYLAGLWERNILRDLLWAVTSRGCVSVPVVYRAPTWSWASLNAPISYSYAQHFDEREVFHAQFIDAQLSHITEDETGLMKDGSIRISGQLAQVKCISRHEFTICGSRLELDIDLDLSYHFGKRAECDLKDRDGKVIEISMGSEFTQHYLRNSFLYLFPVRTTIEPDTEKAELVGLILTPTGRGHTEYMRLGLFVTDEADTQHAILTEALRSNPTIPGQGKNNQCTIVLV